MNLVILCRMVQKTKLKQNMNPLQRIFLKIHFGIHLSTCSDVQPRGFDLGVLRPRRRLLSFGGSTRQEQETAFLLSRLSSLWPFVHSARQDGSSFAVKIYFSPRRPPSTTLPPHRPLPLSATHVAAVDILLSGGSSRHPWHATCFIAH